ncbi:MAG: cupredoxin domain-containing protein [Acidimicrobiales bacterium]
MCRRQIARAGTALVVVAVALAACGGGGTADAVTIESFRFTPQEITVEPGTTVTWANQDQAEHTVLDRSGLGVEESEDLARGDTFSITYDRPGEYPYICGIHQYMTGTVVVAG